MIELPRKWESKLKKNTHYYSLVMNGISEFSAFLDDDLFFFPEYNNHGILHLKNTFYFAERFIHKNAYDSSCDEKGLCYKNITVLVLSTLLHDLGMHITFEGFRCLLKSKKYSEANRFRKKSWSKLWEDFLQEAKRWNDQQKNLIFGDSITIQNIPDEKGLVNQYHKMLCGEFLRRNHHLLAFDIAKTGYPIKDEEVRPYISISAECDPQLKDIIGIIAFLMA